MSFTGKITFVNFTSVKLKIATHQGGTVWHVICTQNYKLWRGIFLTVTPSEKNKAKPLELVT